ncbi:MAG: secretin N-terminal domain-containing protein [Syntrophales bacterium]
MEKLKISTFCAVTVLCLCLSACTAPPKVERSYTPPAARVPLPLEERLEELVISKVEPQKEIEELFSLTLRDEEINQVFLALSRQISCSIIVDPEVKGRVTMDLKKVTLKEVLDTLTSFLGLEYEIKGSIIRVSMPRIDTRVFTLNYVTTTRKGSGKLQAVTGVSGYEAAGGGGSRGDAKGGSTIETGPDTADLWKEIEEGLKNMISKEGKLVINKLGNTVLVTDLSANLKRIAEFLERIEGSVQRQVIIQAKIVEVALSDQYKMGLDWSAISRMGDFSGALSGGMSFAQSLATETGAFQVGVSSGDFNGLLDAMSQQGQLNILSSPKVSTLNNQKAVIKVGREEVFFEPKYDVVTTTDPLTGKIKDTQSALSSVEPRTVTIGIVLDVTPQISSDGYITMNIHPSVTELVKIEEFRVKDEVYATAPVIDIRETDTMVRVSDGQTIVIAGMMQDKKKEVKTRVPFLGDIPFLGNLFSRTEEEKQKTELVILLTPTILVGKRIEELSREELRRLEESKLMSPLNR